MLPKISRDSGVKVTKLSNNLTQQQDTVQGSAELFCCISLQIRLFRLHHIKAKV